ncbi:MAG: YdbH domain-containing protein [Sphingomicrobium sp.]
MSERRRENRAEHVANPETTVVVVRPRRMRFASLIALAVLGVFILGIAAVWIERRPIATHYLKRELDRRGVVATYRLDRVGFRTQQVSNLVIGNPAKPDLVARYAQIQMRLKWNGQFEVYRIVARGVRLRGQLIRGKVSWGEVDKLLPPPSNKPFQLPNFALDVADSTIALRTPFGPVGVALVGSGQLSGGFKGRAALVSPRIAPGRCAGTNLRANLVVAVAARRPQIDGPVTLDRFTCPSSRFDVVAPRFDATASFNESFTALDGRGRMAIASINAGNNGLAAFNGELTYKGSFADVSGQVKLAAQKSRLGTIFADRTRLAGAYRLGTRAGTFALVGDFAADSAALDPSLLAGVTQPLAAAAKTPIGPVATAIGNAIGRTARNFNSAGKIRLVNFPGGGAARIDDADIKGANGARAQVRGGTGVTYYWPAGGLRIDGDIAMSGGGLPSGRVTLRQARAGGPMSGVADLAPYRAGATRLALTPVRFGPGPGGSTALSTIAQLDGPFPDGRAQALRLPIEGRIGRGGAFAFGTACAVVSFDALRTGVIQFGRTRLPVCPIGPAMVTKGVGGPVLASARIGATRLGGRIGSSPLSLATGGGQIVGQRFDLRTVAMRLGRPESPILFDTARLNGTFAGNGISGNFAEAKATIGNVPLLLDQADGKWKVYHGDITVDSAARVTDRGANPRFYPLRSNDLHLTIAGDYVRADGSLRTPDGSRLVTNVDVEHRLSAGAGRALLDVPGLTFGSGFQPDMITRLTEGVIALVNGTVRGTGRIDWTRTGKVTSTGDFTTDNLDLAAPFGPVTGIKGTLHFSDLLGLTTDPGQTLAVSSINPGILVENGQIKYQLLPGQLVRIERGEWPFMGGTLILQETVLNFARPTAKRLTFEVVGLDANTFVQNFGFKEIGATGKFDGVLPMIFDENGGRIVGGRLDARVPGGSLSYVGAVNRANLGFAAKIAFDALKDLHFRTMVVRLDGDLSGEFASRITIDQLGLSGSSGAAKLVRGAFAKVPFRFNINIRGPFRALIQTAKAYKDPRQQINDVLPRPLDEIPGIVTEVRREDETQSQTQTPVTQTIELTPTPPAKR